jgi:hypothetical protein
MAAVVALAVTITISIAIAVLRRRQTTQRGDHGHGEQHCFGLLHENLHEKLLPTNTLCLAEAWDGDTHSALL